LAQAIIAEKRSLCFGRNVLFAHERDIFAAGNRQEKSKAQRRIGVVRIREQVLYQGTPVAGVSTMNHPRQRRPSLGPVEPGAHPFDDPTAKKLRLGRSIGNGDAHGARIELGNDCAKLLAQIRKCGAACRIRGAGIEQAFERRLRGLGERQRIGRISGHGAAKIRGAYAGGKAAQIYLSGTGAIRSGIEIQRTVAESAPHLFKIVGESVIGVLRQVGACVEALRTALDCRNRKHVAQARRRIAGRKQGAGQGAGSSRATLIDQQ